MTKVIRVSFLVAVMIAITGISSCDKSNSGGSKAGTTKLAPPAWIQGKWGVMYLEVFKFTSDDVFSMGVSLKTIWNVSTAASSVTLKETKNTDSIYEITVSASATGQGSASGYYSFKKGDGTYIDAASNETGTPLTNDDYARFTKIN